jgi:Flp pilus assembly protein TadG
VEFAFIGPLYLVMLLGIASYGGYFWIAHSVQQLANDGARAAIAGLSQTERAQLAQSTIASETPSYVVLNPALVTTVESEQTQSLTVTISYDASSSGFWLSQIVPMPSTTISRQATVKLAGF